MDKLTNKEATFLIILLITNVVILVACQAVVEDCSSSSLINGIFVSVIAIIITWIMCILLKKFGGMNLLDISEFLGGKFLKSLVGTIFLIYFLFTTVILLCKISDALQVVYYSSTSLIFILFMFIIAGGILVSFNNKSIYKANLIFLPITIIAILLIFVGNYKSFHFSNIFPILGNGVNSTFISGITNLFAFNGISIIYFLPSKLKDPSKITKISIIAMLISSLLFITCIAIILLMFNNNLVSSQIFPIYLAVRYIEFGSFFQRLDSAFLLFRVISFLGFLAVNTDLSLDIFKNVTNLSDSKPLIAPFMLLIFSATLFIRSNFSLDLFQHTIFKILFFAIVLAAGFTILILANIKKRRVE